MKRRGFLAVSLLVVPLRGQTQANAHVSTTDPLVVAITKGRDVIPGKVKLELPALAVNGHSVAMTVKVDSPMTAAEHVRAVEKNPVRETATFYLGPHSGRAEVGCRYNGAEVFRATLSTGIAANPFLRFFVRAGESGDLDFWWLDDDEHEGTARARLRVS